MTSDSETDTISSDFKVNVKLLKDVKGKSTLEEDIKNAGYKVEEAMNSLGNPKNFKSKNVTVYSWTTPAFGSSTYHYLQNLHRSSMATPVGPFASIVAKDFDFDWNNIKWVSVILPGAVDSLHFQAA